jgi:multiple sugar transport system permease protein
MNFIRRHLPEALLLPLAVLFLLPVVLIGITSLKPDSEVIRFDSVLPKQPTLENFRYIFQTPEEVPLLRWTLNSFIIAASVTVLVLAVSSMAAYALARLRLPGGRVLFAIILATLMVPGQVLLVPVYLLLNQLGWLDTKLALIIPPAAGAFGVFLLVQFFRGVPRELEEAAAIDGCGKWGIYWHIMLPLSRPILATLGIFTFIGSWNDFVGPLVFMDSIEAYTLPVGVALFQSSYASEYGLTLAASVVCTVPILLVFLLFNRQIINGIAAGGLKE